MASMREPRIPEANAAAIGRRFGPSGERFLRELPRRLERIAARWELELGAPLPVGIGGYLVCATTAGGEDAVLKLSPTGDEEQDRANDLEAYALRRWSGTGAVRVLAAAPDKGAPLIERCVPGETIDTLPDDEMIDAGCRLARALHRVPDHEDECVLTGISAASGRPLGLRLSPRAEQVIARAEREIGGEVVVCHGDMNPGNLLAAQRCRWLAVDPLPVLAPPAYDAASLIWSRRAWLLEQASPAAILERRLALAAEAIDAPTGEIRAWTLIRLASLLADRSSWGGYDEAPFVTVAELLCEAAG